jgi:hypothetical protein
MKVNPNDYSTITKKDKKKNNIYKKSNNVSQNNKRLSSPMLQSNKTIKIYINEKLNKITKTKSTNITIKNNNGKKEEYLMGKHTQKINFKNHPNIIKNKIVLSPKKKHSQKRIKVIKKQKKDKEKKIENNLQKNRKQNCNSFNNINCNSIDHNNNSFNVFSQKKEDTKESKLINSISTSSGMSFYSNDNKKNSSNNNNDDKNEAYKDNNNDNIIQNKQYINDFELNKKSIEESSRIKPKINNFNYESGSDDNNSEKKIFLKCDNYSLLTFGNSFSYSNSKRSKSTKKNENNEQKSSKSFYKDVMINNYNDKNNNNYILLNKLKEENETLRKELKHSNEQISMLMYQIKELKQNNIYHSKRMIRNNKKCPPNIWNHKKMRFASIEHIDNNNNHKNSSNYINYKKNELHGDEEKGNEEIKFNKEILKDISKSINEKNIFKNCKIKINIKRNLNLNEKVFKKTKNRNNSIGIIDKPFEKICKCISKLKI